MTVQAYVTFGQVHKHTINKRTFDKDCIAVIEGIDYGDCRKKAFSSFKGEFHNVFDEASFGKMNHDLKRYYPRGLIELRGNRNQ